MEFRQKITLSLLLYIVLNSAVFAQVVVRYPTRTSGMPSEKR